MRGERPYPIRLSPQQAAEIKSIMDTTGHFKSTILRLAVAAFLEKYRDDPEGVQALFAELSKAGVFRPGSAPIASGAASAAAREGMKRVSRRSRTKAEKPNPKNVPPPATDPRERGRS